LSTTETVTVAAASLVLAVVFTPVVAGVARRFGVVDHPGALKPQARAIPYGGGVGVAVGLAVGVAFSRPWVAVPCAMALALGTADDIRPLPPGLRLGGQLATAAVLALVVSSRLSGAIGFVLIMVATVVLMNGFNLLDGVDALCGTVALISAAGFGAILSGDGRCLGFSLACALAGFLVYNLAPARVYLGDGGTYLVGVAMAALLANAWGPHETLSTGLGALILVTLPTAELSLAIVRRARSHRSLVLGDRDHPYDLLMRRGWTRGAATASYGAAAAVLAGIAVAATFGDTALAFLLVGLAAAGILFVSTVAGFLSVPAGQPSGGTSEGS
jgi:UDP-GlcNAc:undecaprenyl-phosphate/decaprenyl-phosphate GlcNAc-1-phosphate transferase